MSKPKLPEELSEQELRRLLLDKRRVVCRQRLERFRRTGRAVMLAPDLPPAALEEWRTSPLDETPEESRLPESARSPRRRWMDRILLVVEVLAVLGLAGILFNGMGLLRTLNQEVAAALQQPTLSPTPLITAVVLPSGHTPPTSHGGAQPNEAEIPEHLRPLVQSLANLPIPTPGPEQAIRIQIPAIQVDAPVVQGVGWDQLKKGVGQYIGSANPGQTGNLVLSGHNDVYGEVFRRLDELEPGDTIITFTINRQYVYVVSGRQIVEPTQVEIMAPTSDPTLTLISCYPYLIDNKRIVVFAKLQNP
ncbi:MAG: class D sortase [Anaerolineales bacterium]|nr:class D sortase [Anaerolineales bacterium]